MSRLGDGVGPVIVTACAVVILQPFSPRACPLWSSMRSWTPVPSCGCAPARPHLMGCARRCGSASGRVHAWHVRRLSDLPVAGRSLMLEVAIEGVHDVPDELLAGHRAR